MACDDSWKQGFFDVHLGPHFGGVSTEAHNSGKGHQARVDRADAEIDSVAERLAEAVCGSGLHSGA